MNIYVDAIYRRCLQKPCIIVGCISFICCVSIVSIGKLDLIRPLTDCIASTLIGRMRQINTPVLSVSSSPCNLYAQWIAIIYWQSSTHMDYSMKLTRCTKKQGCLPLASTWEDQFTLFRWLRGKAYVHMFMYIVNYALLWMSYLFHHHNRRIPAALLKVKLHVWQLS